MCILKSKYILILLKISYEIDTKQSTKLVLKFCTISQIHSTSIIVYKYCFKGFIVYLIISGV